MTRAKRNIEADLKLVDMVMELLDARAPLATQNPDIRRLTKGKQRLVLLNKADLADETVTRKWIAKFREEGAKAIALDSRTRDSIEQVRRAVEELAKDKRERDLRRGITGPRPVKAMVLGIPNVGKSTFINSMLGKASAKTGNKPGVTKGNQWINVSNELLLLDTPGVLWPRFEDRETAYALAEIGAINDQVIQLEDLSMHLLDTLKDTYKAQLFARYEISEADFEAACEAAGEELPLGVKREPLALLNMIAQRRGCLKKQAQPDYDRTARLLIDDFRSGRIGRISLQKPLS